MRFEQALNQQLNKYPKVKKIIKRIYQQIMHAILPKIKSEGNIIQISPNDPNHEYFFGYYDKSPWNITDRYMLCMKAKDTWSDVSPKEKADILLIDTSLPETDESRVQKIAETISWNVQQGCMLQWLGPDFSSRIIYNDYRDGEYVSVILTVTPELEVLKISEERIIHAPIYTVSSDGKTALTLDFSRLYNLRPGYGYHNVPETTQGVALPDATAVWKINIESGEVKPLLRYKDFALFQPRPEMQEKGAIHKVNHLMLNPNGKRCMVLYRWLIGERKYTRLITFDTETGDNMYLLSDDDMVSHCCWKDEEYILAFENKKESGAGYYLMKDKTQEYTNCWPELRNDGHPSYSPDGKFVVTDTYPNRARIAEIKLMNGADDKKADVRIIARVFTPFKYDNDTRCDLHPRWNHASSKICFDSVFMGYRGLFFTEILQQENKSFFVDSADSSEPKSLISVIIPCYNAETTIIDAIKSLELQTYKKIEAVIVDDGSRDNTYNVINSYTSNKIDIKLLRQDNLGVSVARNVGIKHATGEYIAFLDADDTYRPDMLQVLFTAMALSDIDIAICRYVMVDSEDLNVFYNATKRRINGTIGREYSHEELLKMYLDHGKHKINFGGALYRKKTIENNDLYFTPGIKYGEDTEFFIKYIACCKKGIVLHDPMYVYRNVRKSVSHNRKSTERIQVIKSFENGLSYYKHKNYLDDSISKYGIARAIWAITKDYACHDSRNIEVLRREYNVRKNMQYLADMSTDKLIKYSSVMYVINPYVFIFSIKIFFIMTAFRQRVMLLFSFTKRGYLKISGMCRR